MANILSSEERQERDEEFIRQYVELGGNATAAAKAIGVSASSASTTGNRMKKRLWQEIQIEIKSSIETHVPKALHGLVQLADGADSETVRLNAIKDLLDRGGLKPTEKQEIHQANKYENMSKEELEAELAPLRDQFLEDHLKNNNLHLITQEEFDQVEAILEHTMAIHVDGQQDH